MRVLAWLSVISGLVLMLWAGVRLLGEDPVPDRSFARPRSGVVASGSDHVADQADPTLVGRAVSTSRFKDVSRSDRSGGDRRPDRAGRSAGLMVIDPEGHPVPGARVAVGLGLSRAYDDYSRVVVTDDEGLVPTFDDQDHMGVWFCRHGDAEGFILRTELAAETHPFLVLRRRLTVEVVVVDQADRPRADVRVWMGLKDDGGLAHDVPATSGGRARGGVTNADGLVRFEVRGGDGPLGRAEYFFARTVAAPTSPASSPATAQRDPDQPVVGIRIVE